MKNLLLLSLLLILDLGVSNCQVTSHADTLSKTIKKPINHAQSSGDTVIYKRSPEKSFALTPTKIALIQIVTTLLQIAATVLIAWAVYRQANKLSAADNVLANKLNDTDNTLANRLKKVEIQGQAIQAYNILNQVAVSSDENLIALDSIGRENINEPIEIRRKRWCAFVWLEALQLTFFGRHAGMIGEGYADQALQQQLKFVLSDDLVYELVRERGFDPDFVKYCEEIKVEIDKAKVVSASTV